MCVFPDGFLAIVVNHIYLMLSSQKQVLLCCDENLTF